ncbi:hydantoinase/oxoprolinase family protein [Saccharopolyspora sp. ASAGF58]|uniref:hydantoinase/oxoprolinase family protein n=1 Tax=Saccharopolyspora sp. ASAGF58 TaxID=2719023 RepID=UPI00143FDD8F|nr:hydantoinase/oxoprolinase family protein [Saccharopolyspora sp. ASAGF58]QIZ38788.1 hydantoinase/oxoprolinase family protein [Saccharopolyspora sp. ASAGF58]
MSYRLGVDVGGTFTDVVLADAVTGELVTDKVPSDAEQPARAVLHGVRRVLDRSGISPEQIEYFSHGQTFALNTVLQRSGARVGLLVTRGFPDLLSIGRLRLDDPIDLFTAERTPLVAEADVREISERVTVGGVVVRALDPDEVRRAVRELVASGVEAVAVAFLHAHLHPEHERAAASAIAEEFPELPVACSAQLWPEEKEYERATVAVLAAHVGGALGAYLAQLAGALRELGLSCPLHITKSNGGVAAVDERPGENLLAAVETLLSGPASGVAGAIRLAAAAGVHRMITMDMGGTSVDCAVVDGAIPYSTQSRIGEFPLILPSVEVSSIGAGGSSVIRVDPAGVLKVGPRSAGAWPGPACYGRGGTEPTLTDAYVVCGYLDPEDFAAGTVPIDVAAARAALEPVANRLGLGLEEAAESAVSVATAMMHAQLVPLCAQRGIDTADLVLVAYGGAGPVQAALLARALHTAEVLIPASPGTLCALGALSTELRADLVAPIGWRVADEVLARTWEELTAKARAWYLAQEHTLHPDVQLTRWADVQLDGQSFTLPVALADGVPATVAALREAFAADYRRAYAVDPGDAGIDVRTLRITLAAAGNLPLARRQTAEPAQVRPHLVVENGRVVKGEVHRRPGIAAGTEIQGPAVISAPDTTVFVPSGFRATVDGLGNLRLRGEANA